MALNGVITMSKKELYTYEVIRDFLIGRFKRKEVAELLGIRERSVTRLASRVRKKGTFGVKHGNCGKIPENKISPLLRERVLQLVQEHYFDFNLTHCLEKLEADHNITVRYGTFRKWCHKAGLVKNRHRRKSISRRYRSRMPCEGMFIQFDGSPEKWNGREEWTLISGIDDATGKIPYAEFFPSEATLGCMRVLQRIIENKGLPECLYTDRAGIFGGAKRQLFSQFARACDELGIRILFASSAQAKGRIERSFRTLQDRLIPELRIRNIKSMASANTFLNNEFIPRYWNRRNAYVARDPQIRYRPIDPNFPLSETLCLKEWRSISSDQTISLDGKRYLVDFHTKFSIRGQKVEIRTYQDFSTQAFFGGVPVLLTPIEQPQKVPQAICAA